MGWTGIFVRELEWKNGKYDRKGYIDRMMDCENEKYKWEVVKSSMVSTTWYGAIRRINKETLEAPVFGMVVLTSIEGNEFMYKEMDETMGPHSYDCPVGILKLLSPTDSEFALNWRRDCIIYKDTKKRKKKFFERSREEDVHHVEFTCNANFSGGYKPGDVMKLYWRYSAWRKSKWYLTDGHYAWPEKLLSLDHCKMIGKDGNEIKFELD